LGAEIPEYSLRLWHGFTPELLMSVIAICGGVSFYFGLRRYLLLSEGPPLLRHIHGHRIFDEVLVTVSWRIARRLESLLGTRRLQPQLRILVGAALLIGAAPFYVGGMQSDSGKGTPVDLPFAILWLAGIACALGAAFVAKFHRLA